MPNIAYNSCYYLFKLRLEKFSHLTPCVYFRRVISLPRRANLFWSSCFRPSWSRNWARSMHFSQYFGFPNFLLVLESPDLKISKSFHHFCNKIIWWFGVTIVTVIFTCRYFKLSWNTSVLSQSNGRNFSGSSIKNVITVLVKWM